MKKPPRITRASYSFDNIESGLDKLAKAILVEDVREDANKLMQKASYLVAERMRFMLKNREMFFNPKNTIEMGVRDAWALKDSTKTRKENAGVDYPDLQRVRYKNLLDSITARKVRVERGFYGLDEYSIGPVERLSDIVRFQHFGTKFIRPRPFVGIPKDVSQKIGQLWANFREWSPVKPVQSTIEFNIEKFRVRMRAVR